MMSVNFLFKDYMMIDPSYAQKMMVIINIPFSFKLIYGLVIDNVVILGSRKRAYIITGGLL